MISGWSYLSELSCSRAVPFYWVQRMVLFSFDGVGHGAFARALWARDSWLGTRGQIDPGPLPGGRPPHIVQALLNPFAGSFQGRGLLFPRFSIGNPSLFPFFSFLIWRMGVSKEKGGDVSKYEEEAIASRSWLGT